MEGKIVPLERLRIHVSASFSESRSGDDLELRKYAQFASIRDIGPKNKFFDSAEYDPRYNFRE